AKRHRGPLATAAAGLEWKLNQRARVLQPIRVGRQHAAAADRRPTTLELFNRQVDALAEEPSQGALQPIRGHQSFEIAIFTAGEPEQLAVWTGRLIVDGLSRQAKKAGLAA